MRFLVPRTLRFRLIILLSIAIAPAVAVAGYYLVHQYMELGAERQYEALSLNMFTFFLMVVLAFVLAALGSHFLIFRKIYVLIETTKELCAGNFGARTGLPYSGGELGELTRAFDILAESLEVQELQRRRSRDALRQSEQRFRTIFDSVNDAILVLDPVTSAILSANERACELTGYDLDELQRLSATELSSGEGPHAIDLVMELLEKVKTTGPRVAEWHIRSKAGRQFWVEVNSKRAVIDGKEIVLMTARDIVQRKETELALRESESRYRAFIANSSEGIFRIELQNPIPTQLPIQEQVERFYSYAYLAECNDEMARISGEETAEDIIGARMSDYLPRADRRNMEFVKSFIQSGYRLVEAESYRTETDGSEICLLNSLIGLVEKGCLTRAWGVQREITGQKQSEEKLRNLNQFNQEIISHARNGIIVYDTNMNYVLWNRFMEELTGVPAHEVLGKHAPDIFPHLREMGIDRLIRKALEGEICRSEDIFVNLPQSGKHVWMNSNFGPHFNTHGEIIGAIGIVTDIAYRKASEAEVERLGRRNQLILNAAGEGILGLDRDGRIEFANPTSAEMLGYEVDELIGRDLHRLIHFRNADGSENPSCDCPMTKTLTDGSPCRVRDELLWRKNGTAFPAAYASTPIIEDGQITGAVITFRDITARIKADEARQKLEGQLRQAQKMEAIGTLAGGIAHDFNNILTPIIGYCELSLQEIAKNSSLHGKIEQVLKSSLRAKDLVSQILTFSRKREQELRPVQISLVIGEALTFLRSSLPSTITIRRQIDPGADTGKVLADPTRIHQIVINLCANAAHAMGEKGGTLGVALSLKRIGPTPDRRFPELEPGNYLRLSISDTGHGIDEKSLQRIFEPYFTTKSPSEGTGLGLAVVYGIVKGLGGNISVKSQPGLGATFDVLLPLVVELEDAAIEGARKLSVGSGHILLVDDETAIVDLQKEMVEHLGYSATVKYNSLDALEAFRDNPGCFDLIITDQTMPQMTGVELAKEALKIRYDIPIIVCTGFSETIDDSRARTEGIRLVLMKPLLLHDLAEAIRRVLAKE